MERRWHSWRDEKKGKEILNIHRKGHSFYIDACVIAHLKRIKTDLVLTTDHEFFNVAKKENLNTQLVLVKR